jgi:signal recognition particle subunit SRP54
MQAIRSMGPMSKLLGMLPGMGELRSQIENIDEKEIDRVAAIIQSMTPAERKDVKLLNGSRRVRIARGSGTEVADVNRLVDRFLEARTMMAQMAKGGGMPGMPGLPGMGGGRRPKTQKNTARKAKAGRSGNPAKRAEQERLAALQATEGGNAGPDQAKDFELPEEFKGLLG